MRALHLDHFTAVMSVNEGQKVRTMSLQQCVYIYMDGLCRPCDYTMCNMPNIPAVMSANVETV